MRVLIILLAATIHASAIAQLKVVVIPLAGNDVTPLQNIITVALKNGDFTSPIDAVNSIPSQGPKAPSRTNPYLIVIAPGLYELTQSLFIPSHVSLAGSGRKTTILQFELENTIMGSATAITTSLNVSISDLAIQNVVLSGPPQRTFGVAISNDSNEVLLERLNILTAGHSNNIGVRNRAGHADIHDIEVVARGGSSAIAVNYTDGATGRIVNLVASGQESLGQNVGMVVSDSSPSITNAQIRINRASSTATGIKLIDSRASITSSFIGAFSDFLRAVAVDIEGTSSAPMISNSILNGSTHSVDFNEEADKASITGSRFLGGGVGGDPSGTQCRDNYDSILKSVSC